MTVLPGIPGDGFYTETFARHSESSSSDFFFVTVASRIVGLVGSSNSPYLRDDHRHVDGHLFDFYCSRLEWKAVRTIGLGGRRNDLYRSSQCGCHFPGFERRGTSLAPRPRYQQLALFIGAIVSSIAIGLVVKVLDTANSQTWPRRGLTHAIGSERYAAPQATLMATLAKGILSYNLDWQFVMVGVFIAVMIELCGIKALAFAIGLYLAAGNHAAHIYWRCHQRELSNGSAREER
jgi:hypothetical protein